MFFHDDRLHSCSHIRAADAGATSTDEAAPAATAAADAVPAGRQQASGTAAAAQCSCATSVLVTQPDGMVAVLTPQGPLTAPSSASTSNGSSSSRGEAAAAASISAGIASHCMSAECGRRAAAAPDDAVYNRASMAAVQLRTFS